MGWLGSCPLRRAGIVAGSTWPPTRVGGAPDGDPRYGRTTASHNKSFKPTCRHHYMLNPRHCPSIATAQLFPPPPPQAKGMYSELRPVAPLLSYATVSLSNVVASTCQ